MNTKLPVRSLSRSLRLVLPAASTLFLSGLLLTGPAGASTLPNYGAPYAFTTLAGSAAIGSTDGSGNVARFNFPQGIAVDASGNISVADSSNHTIRKVSPAGFVSTLAGKAGYPVDPNDPNRGNGNGGNARFTEPAGVTVDAAGNVFVAGGSDNAIRKITPAGVVTTVAGGGPASPFNSPQGITIDSAGVLYVADTSNFSIKKVTPAGAVTTLAGGSYGSADGTGSAARFYSPRGIAVDSAGTVYVADTYNHTIRKISVAGDVTTFAGIAGSPGHVDGFGTAAQFDTPTGLAMDPAGYLYVADSGNSTIRKIAPSGAVTTVAGAIGMQGHADGTSTARFFQPVGVALDPVGNLLVVDAKDQAIRKITPSGVVSTVAGFSPFQCNGSVDGVVGTDARFSRPDAVAVGPGGELYVADLQNHTLRKITPGGSVSTLAGAAGSPGYVDGPGTAARFFSPVAVAVDAAGIVYVADQGNSVLRRISPAGVVSTLAGRQGIRGETDGPFGTATLGTITGVAALPNGNVVVAEDSRLRTVTPAGTVTTMPLAPPLPFSNFNGIAADPVGNIYVLGGLVAEVLKITPSGTQTRITPYFLEANGIAVDRSGNIFFTSRDDYLVWEMSATGVVSLVGGLLDARGSSDGVSEEARFENPLGIALDANGNIYVTCSAYFSSSVRKGQLAGPPVITTQPYSQAAAPGSSAQFSVIASGFPAPTYQWYFNGTRFNGATSSTLNLVNVQQSDAGVYTVVVTNALAALTSNQAALIVSTGVVTPPPSTSSGGGGAFSEWFLLALLLLGAGRFFTGRRGAPV